MKELVKKIVPEYKPDRCGRKRKPKQEVLCSKHLCNGREVVGMGKAGGDQKKCQLIKEKLKRL